MTFVWRCHALYSLTVYLRNTFNLLEGEEDLACGHVVSPRAEIFLVPLRQS